MSYTEIFFDTINLNDDLTIEIIEISALRTDDKEVFNHLVKPTQLMFRNINYKSM